MGNPNGFSNFSRFWKISKVMKIFGKRFLIDIRVENFFWEKKCGCLVPDVYLAVTISKHQYIFKHSHFILSK